MKKLLYIFLVLPLIFSSCSKDDDDNTPVIPPASVQGCTDADATNYNSAATTDDGSCLYDPSGVWQATSAVLNGTNVLQGLDLIYIWDDGTIGTETYDVSGNMTSYAIGAGVSAGLNVINWTGTVYPTGGTEYPAYLTINIDIMTDNNNMTWHYVDYPTAADTYFKTLIRSTTYSLDDWK